MIIILVSSCCERENISRVSDIIVPSICWQEEDLASCPEDLSNLVPDRSVVGHLLLVHIFYRSFLIV